MTSPVLRRGRGSNAPYLSGAWEMGEEWSQKRVSLLEQKESIDEAILKQVAEVLKVPVEAIQNFDDEMVVNIVTNTFSDFKDNATASPVAMNYQCTFDPVDKLVQLHEEKIVLYERMLKEKDEMMEMLKGLVESLKA